MIDSFSVIFIFLSSFYQIYLKKIWNNFYTRTVFTLVSDFFYNVDTEGGDEAANFTELDSDYSEPGKHV